MRSDESDVLKRPAEVALCLPIEGADVGLTLVLGFLTTFKFISSGGFSTTFLGLSSRLGAISEAGSY